MFISIGFTTDQHENFSVRCILYGLKLISISPTQQLFRLLYILIGCALLLLAGVIGSLIADRYRLKSAKAEEEEQLNRRTTVGRLGSLPARNERASSVHGFIQ